MKMLRRERPATTSTEGDRTTSRRQFLGVMAAGATAVALGPPVLGRVTAAGVVPRSVAADRFRSQATSAPVLTVADPDPNTLVGVL